VPASQVQELGALLGLRDSTLAFLNAEAASAEDSDLIVPCGGALARAGDGCADLHHE
jgi:hypothetical protein